MIIGYHASHEQFSPSELLKLAQKAENAGFKAILCSDHFHPWSEAQGHSGFAWSWLGAAMQLTTVPFRVVNAPGDRYHPAIIAQAAATLQEMCPDRFGIAIGSGQALNEHITGNKYPIKADRNKRLFESQEVMRKLWNGENLTYQGEMVTVENAKLYSLPKNPPMIIGAAITPETAEWVGSWADALITVSKPIDKLKKVVDAFRSGGGKEKPMLLKVQVSYHQDEKKARQGAFEQWKTNIFKSSMLSELQTPQQFEAAAKFVTPDQLDEYVNISSDVNQHIKWLRSYADLGFDELLIHNVNKDQEQFIEAYGKHVIPALMQK